MSQGDPEVRTWWVMQRNEISWAGLEGVTYSDLFDRYANSDIGQHHAAQPPRYAQKYAYTHDEMHRDLGPDVHPVEHGRYTHDEVLMPLLWFQLRFGHNMGDERFTDSDIVALRIAAHMHDFGECEHPLIKEVVGGTVGDVEYHKKTEEHANTEARVRKFLRQHLFADIPDELWEQSERIIAEQGTDAPIKAFALTEHIGYYRTGLRAGYLAVMEARHRRYGTPQRDDLSFERLRSLGKNVSAEHRTETIPEKASGFPYAEFVLAQTTDLFEFIQAEL